VHLQFSTTTPRLVAADHDHDLLSEDRIVHLHVWTTCLPSSTRNNATGETYERRSACQVPEQSPPDQEPVLQSFTPLEVRAGPAKKAPGEGGTRARDREYTMVVTRRLAGAVIVGLFGAGRKLLMSPRFVPG
jgi:hypothetical protein